MAIGLEADWLSQNGLDGRAPGARRPVVTPEVPTQFRMDRQPSQLTPARLTTQRSDAVTTTATVGALAHDRLNPRSIRY